MPSVPKGKEPSREDCSICSGRRDAQGGGRTHLVPISGSVPAQRPLDSRTGIQAMIWRRRSQELGKTGTSIGISIAQVGIWLIGSLYCFFFYLPPTPPQLLWPVWACGILFLSQCACLGIWEAWCFGSGLSGGFLFLAS